MGTAKKSTGDYTSPAECTKPANSSVLIGFKFLFDFLCRFGFPLLPLWQKACNTVCFLDSQVFIFFPFFQTTPPVYFSGTERSASKFSSFSPPVPPRSCYSGRLRQQNRHTPRFASPFRRTTAESTAGFAAAAWLNISLAVSVYNIKPTRQYVSYLLLQSEPLFQILINFVGNHLDDSASQ